MIPPQTLSTREIQVLNKVAKGKLNKEIANDLAITEGTVKQHLSKIYGKIGVGNRVEASNAFRNLKNTIL
jgi:DNA-binding NarL/FixJ family response regulator